MLVNTMHENMKPYLDFIDRYHLDIAAVILLVVCGVAWLWLDYQRQVNGKGRKP